MVLSLQKILFGPVHFPDNDEYRAFQFRFLCIVLIAGGLVTLLLLSGSVAGVNPIRRQHSVSMTAFTTISFGLWLVLRGQPHRFYPVAWTYELICLAEYISALIFVSEDEMRVIWFFTNVPGVYILLGQRAGMVITILTVTGLALANRHLPRPYSVNGLATVLSALVYLGAFFHVYGARSVSYFVRMRESNQRLRHIASHDALTDLLNAGAYYASCDQMIHLAARQGKPYSVLFVDLDHFKKINDTYGHEAGDTVLRSVASVLASSVRQSDAVGRIGGEEFSVFLPDTDRHGAFRLAEQLRQNIEQLRPQSGEICIPVTASIGIATSDHSDMSMAVIQRKADQAMYVAKQQGRNRVSLFDQPAPF
jgi:diguanylate cyclase (GGDEF)-like protein